MSTIQDTNANRSLFWGGIAGSLYVFLTYIFYEILGIDYFVGYWKFIPYTLVLAIMVYAGIEKRKQVGGYINFKTAISHMFLVMVLAEIFYGIFTYVLYNYITPDLAVQLKAKVIEAIQVASEKFGLPAKEMQKSIADIEKEDMMMTLPRTLLNIGMSICLGFFMAAIAAAIIKKKDPSEGATIVANESNPQ